jgi:hypothetical protein
MDGYTLLETRKALYLRQIGHPQSLAGKNQLNLLLDSGQKVTTTNHSISLSGPPGGP